MYALENFINFFALYFLVIDPIGTLAVFLSVLPNIKNNKEKVALEAVFYAFLILVFFLLLGGFILEHLNIDLYSLKIAGGIILLIISLEMMFDKRLERKEKIIKSDDIYNPIFPLAIPLLAGPASITSVIVTTSDSFSYSHYISNVLAILAVLIITLFLFLMTLRFERFLKKQILQVTSRIIGILLAALSLQYILDGISQFIG